MSSPFISPSRLLKPAVHQIQRHAPFDRMAEEHLDFLAAHLKLSYFTAGEVILSPEQGAVERLFIIRQGTVVSDDEQAVRERDLSTTVQLVAGECFPLGALQAQRPVTHHFRAVGDVFLLELAVEHFHALLDNCPPFRDFCTRPMVSLQEISFRQTQVGFFLSGNGPPTMNTTLRHLMENPPLTCPRETAVGEALALLHRQGGDCLVVVDDHAAVQGIFTLGDLLERVTLAGRDLATPMQQVMTTPPHCLPPEATAREAVLLMADTGLRRILVTEAGRLLGMVTESQIFPLQRTGLTRLHQEIHTADHPSRLARATQRMSSLIQDLLAQGVGMALVAEIITSLNQRLARRILHLEHQNALHRGELSPDLRFCWLTMGSDGRRDLSLRGDQDNGLIYLTPPGMDPVRAGEQLSNMALRVNNQLDYCGVPLCQGKIMAGNPKWCLPREEWRNLFQRWIDRGNPDDLLQASILFDFRPQYGDAELAGELRQWLAGATVNRRFLHQMTSHALRNRPPLGLIRDFALNNAGGIDLKLNGIMPFVDAARIFALSCGVAETGTPQRLLAASGPLKLNEADVQAWIHAFHYLQWLRLRVQLERAGQGLPLSHTIQPHSLNELDQRILKEVFRQARKLQARLAMEFQR